MEPLTTFILLAALSITLFIVLVVLWLRGQDVKQLRRENKILLKSKDRLTVEQDVNNSKILNLVKELNSTKKDINRFKDEQVEHTKLVQSLEEKQGALRRQFSNLASQLHTAETEREVLRDKVKSLKKQKISLQNQMATAWRQVQDWKEDEDGNQRTLTGAIDAGLDDKDAQIAQLKKEFDLLTSKTRSIGGRTSFRR
mgnify:CR=1 FL=1